MWDLRFDSVTFRGLRVARDGEPVEDGEFSIIRHRSQCAWFRSTPERYQYVDVVFSEFPGWADEQAAREAEIAALAARVAMIEQAQEATGIHKYTVEQAQAFVNNLLDEADTGAKMKEAVRTLFLRVVPYIIRTS